MDGAKASLSLADPSGQVLGIVRVSEF